MNKRTALFAIATLTAVTTVGTYALLPRAPRQVQSHVFVDPVPVPSSHFPPELGDGLLFNTRSGGLSEHLRVALDWRRGDKTVAVEWKESIFGGLFWYTTRVVEVSSYTITGIGDCEGGRILYVAGVRNNGNKILEKWTFAARQGGYAIKSLNDILVPFGNPMPDFQAVERVNGQSWIPPAQAVNTGSPAVREHVWAGSETGILCAVVADPNRRYVVVLSYPDGRLYQIYPDSAQPTPTVILTPTEVPYLAGASRMVMWRHASQGRKIVITKAVGRLVDTNRLLLSDADNDGVFETSALYTATEWAAAGYAEDSVWNYYMDTGEVDLDWDH